MSVSKSVSDRLDALLDVADDLVDEQEEGTEQKEFEIVPFEKKETKLPATENTDVVDDYAYARSTLYGVLDRGQTALDSLLKIAMYSEHPRAFQVLQELSKTLIDGSGELLALQKKLNDAQKGNIVEDDGKTVVNQQNNFYGGEKTEAKDVNELLKSVQSEDGV